MTNLTPEPSLNPSRDVGRDVELLEVDEEELEAAAVDAEAEELGPSVDHSKSRL